MTDLYDARTSLPVMDREALGRLNFDAHQRAYPGHHRGDWGTLHEYEREAWRSAAVEVLCKSLDAVVARATATDPPKASP